MLQILTSAKADAKERRIWCESIRYHFCKQFRARARDNIRYS